MNAKANIPGWWTSFTICLQVLSHIHSCIAFLLVVAFVLMSNVLPMGFEVAVCSSDLRLAYCGPRNPNLLCFAGDPRFSTTLLHSTRAAYSTRVLVPYDAKIWTPVALYTELFQLFTIVRAQKDCKKFKRTDKFPLTEKKEVYEMMSDLVPNQLQK